MPVVLLTVLKRNHYGLDQTLGLMSTASLAFATDLSELLKAQGYECIVKQLPTHGDE